MLLSNNYATPIEIKIDCIFFKINILEEQLAKKELYT